MGLDSYIGLEFTELLVVGARPWLDYLLDVVSDLRGISLLEVLEFVLLGDGDVAFLAWMLVGLLRQQIDVVGHLITIQLVKFLCSEKVPLPCTFAA